MRIDTTNPDFNIMAASLHENLEHAIRCMVEVQQRELSSESFFQTRAELVEALGLICEGFLGEDPFAPDLNRWLEAAASSVGRD